MNLEAMTISQSALISFYNSMMHNNYLHPHKYHCWFSDCNTTKINDDGNLVSNSCMYVVYVLCFSLVKVRMLNS